MQRIYIVKAILGGDDRVWGFGSRGFRRGFRIGVLGYLTWPLRSLHLHPSTLHFALSTSTSPNQPSTFFPPDHPPLRLLYSPAPQSIHSSDIHFPSTPQCNDTKVIWDSRWINQQDNPYDQGDGLRNLFNVRPRQIEENSSRSLKSRRISVEAWRVLF